MDQSVKIQVEDFYAKATFNKKKKKNFHQQIGLKCEILHLQHSLLMYSNLVTSGKKNQKYLGSSGMCCWKSMKKIIWTNRVKN